MIMSEYEFINDNVFVVHEFLSHSECDEYIQLAEAEGFEEAPITTRKGPVMAKEIRNNERVMLDDEKRAKLLWSRVEAYVPQKIRSWNASGLNERLRFYRYDIGQQFDWHYDGRFRRDETEQSHLTFMVYLNDDFEGGETCFESTDVCPKRGMALVFTHQIIHRGAPVVNGRKYVLRSDVMYKHRKQA